MSESRRRRAPSLGAAHIDLADFEGSETTNAELIARRGEHFGGSLLFYHDPVLIERGEGVWLYDQNGNRYLDCYNNVPSVGHCNARVLEALTKQAATLNTHTRYLHPTVIDYAESLAATFPEPLEVCFFVCTGTEANELAMRMARAVSGNNGAVVMENSYHGNSTLIGELSTATSRPGDRPDHVCAVEPPHPYRGKHANDDNPLDGYLREVDEAIATLDSRGQGTAAFLCDAIFDSQGGIEAPAGYFAEVYARIRAAGGLVIADEVQPGFARTGRMWGFENYDVVPDIVTLGKPMGNGHPLAGVVTTREIARAFTKSSFYFNTFGGNPVAAAVGQAVLDEITEQNLPAHVTETGAYLRTELERLAGKRPLIGNIEGIGLYQGIDLVTNHESREPAAEIASQVPDAMKARGILMGLTGRYGSVLKVRPPLIFDKSHVDMFIENLDEVLGSFS